MIRTKSTSIRIDEVYKDNIKPPYNDTVTESHTCCSFLKYKGIKPKNSKTYIRFVIFVKHKNLMDGFNDRAFIDKWLAFIDGFGLDLGIKVKEDESTVDMTAIEFSSCETISNYYNTFRNSIVRYLYHENYTELPSFILKLRDDKSLSDLDNWEIFQLGHLKYDYNHYDYFSSIRSMGLRICAITDVNFLRDRLHINLGSHLCTFNRYIKQGEHSIDKIYSMMKDSDYIGVYNLLNSKANKLNANTHALCINADGFDGQLIHGNIYELNSVKNNRVIIRDNCFEYNIYNKNRFKLI